MLKIEKTVLEEKIAEAAEAEDYEKAALIKTDLSRLEDEIKKMEKAGVKKQAAAPAGRKSGAEKSIQISIAIPKSLLPKLPQRENIIGICVFNNHSRPPQDTPSIFPPFWQDSKKSLPFADPRCPYRPPGSATAVGDTFPANTGQSPD